MSGRTGIEWTDRTWNPVVGCSKVSQGCKFCYAKTVHDRRHKAFTEGKKKVAPQYAVPFETVQLKPDRLSWPLKLQEPSLIFVNSVSDLFHEDVPFEFIAKVFAVMSLATRHVFQVLTKRPDRALAFFDWVAAEGISLGHMMSQGNAEPWDGSNVVTHHAICSPDLGLDRVFQRAYDAVSDSEPPEWPLPNVWIGVSVENQEAADQRIPLLLQIPAAVRWLSMEPLLGDVDLSMYIEDINWVVVGGESGSKKQLPRPMHPAWALSIRDQCVKHGVPFLFKQWGDYANEAVAGTSAVLAELKPNQLVAWGDGETNHVRFTRVGKKKAGRILDGRTWDEYPAVAA